MLTSPRHLTGRSERRVRLGARPLRFRATPRTPAMCCSPLEACAHTHISWTRDMETVALAEGSRRRRSFWRGGRS